MKNRFLILIITSLILSSCEGIKHIYVYNLSTDTVKIYTSRPRLDAPKIYLDRYPQLRLQPSDTLTKEQKLKYYKNLFDTDNNIIESLNNIEIYIKPKSAIKIGGSMWAAYPEKIKAKDLYIDYLVMCVRQDSIITNNRSGIIELTRDKRFAYKKSDKSSIKLNGRLFKNIVIR